MFSSCFYWMGHCQSHPKFGLNYFRNTSTPHSSATEWIKLKCKMNYGLWCGCGGLRRVVMYHISYNEPRGVVKNHEGLLWTMRGCYEPRVMSPEGLLWATSYEPRGVVKVRWIIDTLVWACGLLDGPPSVVMDHIWWLKTTATWGSYWHAGLRESI